MLKNKQAEIFCLFVFVFKLVLAEPGFSARFIGCVRKFDYLVAAGAGASAAGAAFLCFLCFLAGAAGAGAAASAAGAAAGVAAGAAGVAAKAEAANNVATNVATEAESLVFMSDPIKIKLR